MIRRLLNLVVANWTAFKAGWIVSACEHGCYADDETESVFACIFHERQIADLSERNDRAYRASHT